MKDCDRFERRLSDYLEENLDAEQKKILQSHLKECSHCSSIVKRVERLRKRLAVLSKPVLSPDFDTILRARIRIENALERRTLRSRLLQQPLAIPLYGVSIVLLVVIALVIWGQIQRSQKLNSDMLMPAYSSGNLTRSQAGDISLDWGKIENRTIYVIDRISIESLPRISATLLKRDLDSLGLKRAADTTQVFKTFTQFTF